MAPPRTLSAWGQAHSRRSCSCCKRGLVHIADSSTNETTRTAAAAHANSQAGTGRLARPEIPCALACAGSAALRMSRHRGSAANLHALLEMARWRQELRNSIENLLVEGARQRALGDAAAAGS